MGAKNRRPLGEPGTAVPGSSDYSPGRTPTPLDPSDAEALWALADRLDRDGRGGRPLVANAARVAAAMVTDPSTDGRAAHVAALRRRAIEVAVRLDTLGLPDEAESVYAEVLRRTEGAPEAMGDRPFQKWLVAIEGSFPGTGPAPEAGAVT